MPPKGNKYQDRDEKGRFTSNKSKPATEDSLEKPATEQRELEAASDDDIINDINASLGEVK